MASNQIINNKIIKRKVAENEKVEIEEVNKVQHITREVKFVAITAKTEVELRESCDIEDGMRVKKSRMYKDVNQ